MTSTSRSTRTMVRLVGAAVVTVLAATMTTAPAEAKVTKKYFGMHDGSVLRSSDHALPPGTGSLRLWDAGVAWSQIEKSPGQFDWTMLDAYVEAADKSGARILLAMGQTPRFHASKPKQSAFYGKGAASNPSMKAWKRYVGKLTSRYGNAIDYQIWNEPNVKGFWSGSPAQMAKLTKAASKKIDANAPKAKIVAPSFPLRLRGQRAWFGKYWSQKVGGGKKVGAFLDIAAVNPYPLPDQKPEASIKLVDWARKTLKKKGVRKPIWNTEINYGLLGGGTADPIPMKVQVSYVIRTFVLNAQHDVSRVFWYRWDLRQIANTVMTDNGQVTKAGKAFREVRSWLIGTRATGCETSKKGVWTCTFKNGKGVKRVYWRPSGSGVKVRAVKSARTITTQDGSTSSINGGARFTVTKFPKLVFSKK